MDTATYDAVRPQHPNAERRDLELKGKAAPVEAFTIRGR
jgi:class 3 adenylate cyclase